MTPDYQNAAVKALETLIQFNVTSAPVIPLPILKSIPGVLVLSFAEMAAKIGNDRSAVISMFGAQNQDAVTTVRLKDGKIHYVVAYNQRLPFYMLQRSLARELGHIVLQHDGTRPEDIRMEEARIFARHLILPRPLIMSIKDSGIPLTIEVVGNVTGCYERCLNLVRKTPGIEVPPALNRQVRAQFAEYVQNFVNYQSILTSEDDSAVANFGTYLEGYRE